jgi:hypothetical protein
MRILFRLFVAIIFISLLVAIIAYARGYRFNVKEKSLTSTGILALSSSPKPGKVYINGELKGVTDLNLTLPPGQYNVQIKKEGYTEWSQSINLKGEIVTSLDALLFPKNPSLSPSTNIGVVKAISVDQTDNVLLFSHNDDPEKDGAYLFDSNQRPLSFIAPLQPIILEKTLPKGADLQNAVVSFSPDYRQAIFDVPFADAPTESYLLTLDQENVTPFNITGNKDSIVEAWLQEKNNDMTKILETFPLPIQKVASDSFKLIAFSPDETKILYKANEDTIVSFALKAPLIGANQMNEERSIHAGSFYVYDKKEDKNFAIPDLKGDVNKITIIPTGTVKKPATQPLTKLVTKTATITIPVTQATLPLLDIATDGDYPVMWYPDSKHLVIKQSHEIIVVDYDGSNKRTIYSGPFDQTYFTVTTEGKLFVLTNLNPQYNKFADLYEIGIR